MDSSFGTFSLSGKTAIITGGGSGIGQAICELFAKRGAAVQVLDVSIQNANTVAKIINDSNAAEAKATAWKCDVTNQSEVERVFKSIASNNPRVDILVNNAGIGHVGDVLQTTAPDMEKMYKVNVAGVYHCLKAGVSAMLSDDKGGAIVNLASIASVIGLSDRFAYSASKGAVLTMTLSVATDYVKRGIRCNAVCPARIHTPFVDDYLQKNYPGKEKEMFANLSNYQPIGRMGEPREVAALILYLCSDEAKFVTGAAYPVDGGVCAKM